eukprot:Tamp_27206.p1 GENE.Tamp_27206~~Tamp_27206.p1  ORF type:complete len:183 (+),score=5.69 Tamp_27206:124-672(+)
MLLIDIGFFFIYKRLKILLIDIGFFVNVKGVCCRHRFSKVRAIVPLYSKCPCSLNFQNVSCSGCNSKISSDIRFCGTCGTANAACKVNGAATPATPAGAAEEASTFTVQLPPEAVGGQKMRVTVPAGFACAGEPVEFVVPVEARGGQRIKVPLPSVTRQGGGGKGAGGGPPSTTSVAPGCFR